MSRSSEKTGVGKTTLLYNMAFADLHRSLVADLLGVVPRSRANHVILLNPAINILE